MTDRTALPIPDDDQLPEGSLAHRIRSLPAPDLQRLLDYEQGHGNSWLWCSYSHSACTCCNPETPLHRRVTHRLRSPNTPPPPVAGSGANPAASPANNQPLRHGVAAQTPNRDIRAR